MNNLVCVLTMGWACVLQRIDGSGGGGSCTGAGPQLTCLVRDFSH